MRQLPICEGSQRHSSNRSSSDLFVCLWNVLAINVMRCYVMIVPMIDLVDSAFWLVSTFKQSTFWLRKLVITQIYKCFIAFGDGDSRPRNNERRTFLIFANQKYEFASNRLAKVKINSRTKVRIQTPDRPVMFTWILANIGMELFANDERNIDVTKTICIVLMRLLTALFLWKKQQKQTKRNTKRHHQMHRDRNKNITHFIVAIRNRAAQRQNERIFYFWKKKDTKNDDKKIQQT